MKKLTRYSFLLVITLIFSCNGKLLLVSCQDCTDNEPIETTLEVKTDFSRTDSNNAEVKLYEGNIEDNLLKGTYYVTDLNWTVAVKVNKKYTLSATYVNSDGSVYIAVDSAIPRVKYETSQCKSPCYYVYDRKINLKLKYSDWR